MSRRTVPGICFHGIGSPQRDLEEGEADYWISEDFFHALMDEVATWPDVDLSFDDSNASDVRFGLPALQGRGLAATFFILAGRLNSSGSLDPAQVRLLAESGMRIGSHGMDHVPWRGLSDTAAIRELVEARAMLADVVGAPVDDAALPLGRYDRLLLSRLRQLGYRSVHTSDRRRADPTAWMKPRFSVRRTDTVQSVREAALTDPALLRRWRDEAKAVVKRLR